MKDKCVLIIGLSQHCERDDPIISPQDLGISKVGHMKRILQGTKDLAKASMVDL